MQSWRFAVLGLLALPPLFSLGAGCNGEPAPAGASTDGGSPDVDERGLDPQATAFVAELCDAYARCCRSSPAADCTTATSTEARGLSFDAARAEKCLESVRAAAKTATLCTERPASTACEAVFKQAEGNEPGKDCARSSECSSGDDGDGLCILQKCRRAARGNDGDACIGTRTAGRTEIVFGATANAGAVCDASDGLYCSESSRTCKKRGPVGASCSGPDVSCVDDAWCPRATSECAPRTAVGAACEDEYECALGARCANDGSGGGACTALAEVGGACERGDECDGQRGLICDADSTKCVEDASLAKQACTGSLALASGP